MAAFLGITTSLDTILMFDHGFVCEMNVRADMVICNTSAWLAHTC